MKISTTMHADNATAIQTFETTTGDVLVALDDTIIRCDIEATAMRISLAFADAAKRLRQKALREDGLLADEASR